MNNSSYTLTRWIGVQTLRPQPSARFAWWVRVWGTCRQWIHHGFPNQSMLTHDSEWWVIRWHPDGLEGHATPKWSVWGHWQLRLTRLSGGEWRVVSWYDPIGIKGWLYGWVVRLELKWVLKHTLILSPMSSDTEPPGTQSSGEHP